MSLEPHESSFVDYKTVMIQLAESLGLNGTKLKEMINKTLDSPYYLFPVRHHSLASSLQLLRAFKEQKPELILLEAPSDCQELLRYITDRETKVPISIFSYFKDDDNQFGLNGLFTPDETIPMKYKVWYPFVEYSPEYIAMQYAVKTKIPMYFIDLPYLSIMKHINEENKDYLDELRRRKKEQEAQLREQQEQLEQVYGEQVEIGKPKPSDQEQDEIDAYLTKHDSESLLHNNKFFETFCKQFDVPNINEFWDLVFEVGTHIQSTQRYRELMFTFCAASRLNHTEKFLKSDGIIVREEYMLQEINRIKKLHPTIAPEKIMIITGGFHSVALSINNDISMKKISVHSMFNTLVPFSYTRLSTISGYAAGIKAPNFTRYVWPQLQNTKEKHPYKKAVLELILNIMKKARQRGYMYSTADTISVFQTATMLASLRRRLEPNDRDLYDSLIACCVKGNPKTEALRFQDIIFNEYVGYKIGKVTTKIGKAGLQQDFYNQIEHFRIDLSEKEIMITIDLRNEDDNRKSEFLWQLKFLDIDLAEPIVTPDLSKHGRDLFHEKWQISWSNKIDAVIVEKSIYGSTIEEASINTLNEQMIEHIRDAKFNSHLLYSSFKMGLNNQFETVSSNFIKTLNADHNVFNLIESFRTLFLVSKIISVIEPKYLKKTHHLLQRNYYAICSQIINYADVKPEQEDGFLEELRDLANLVHTSFEITFDIELFDGTLLTIFSNSGNARIKGSTLGLRYLLGTASNLELKNELLAFATGDTEHRLMVGDFVRGIVEACYAKILFDDEIIRTIVKIVEELQWANFMVILPSLRKAFTLLSGKDYDTVIEKIATIYSLIEVKQLIQVNPNEQLKLMIKLIDQRVHEVLDDW